MIYIHCSAHVCLKNSNDTKCQFGCDNRRRRRSVEDNSLTRLDDLSKDYDIRTGLIIITDSSKSKLFEIPNAVDQVCFNLRFSAAEQANHSILNTPQDQPIFFQIPMIAMRVPETALFW